MTERKTHAGILGQCRCTLGGSLLVDVHRRAANDSVKQEQRALVIQSVRLDEHGKEHEPAFLDVSIFRVGDVYILRHNVDEQICCRNREQEHRHERQHRKGADQYLFPHYRFLRLKSPNSPNSARKSP